MACTRGCSGTPLCSALNLCCIQLTHDCGKGCLNLPVGYSTVQINDVGNLEVCSNVGGVCTCTEISAGGTISSVTNNGDGTWDHDDGDGTVVTLDICDLIDDGNCSDTLVDNADGTYTHTDLQGNAVIIDICSAMGVIDTNCIDLTLVATAAGCSIQADLIIDPDACNGLECRANGAFVNNDIQQVNGNAIVSSILVNVPAPGGMPAVPTSAGGTATLTLANPSACNPMSLTREVQSSIVRLDNSCGIAARVIVDLEFSTVGAGGPWTSVEPAEVIVPAGGFLSVPTPSLSAAFVQAVGGSNSLWVRHVFSNPDGNFCGAYSTGDKAIVGSGVNYIN